METTAFCDILHQQGLLRCTGVPCSVFTPLVNALTVDPRFDYLPAASEGEAVAIAAGLRAADSPAFCLMQNSGLGNAVNPITSLLHIYRIPVQLLVSQRGQPGKPDEPQHQLMGVITEELARLCGLRTEVFDPERFSGQLSRALEDGVPAAWIFRKGALTGGPTIRRGGFEALCRPRDAAAGDRLVPQASREQALEALLPLLNRRHGGKLPAVVATTGKLSRELYELDDRDHQRGNRFYMVGSMGCAAGFGLGVARGGTGHRVVVLDGDGAVLMKLGSLATIGHSSPSSFHHIVFDNAAYESTGCQPTVSPSADLAAIAAACGYREAETVVSEDQLIATLERHLAAEGPTMIRVLVETGSRADLGRPKLSPRDGWTRFCAFLRSGD